MSERIKKHAKKNSAYGHDWFVRKIGNQWRVEYQGRRVGFMPDTGQSSVAALIEASEKFSGGVMFGENS